MQRDHLGGGGSVSSGYTLGGTNKDHLSVSDEMRNLGWNQDEL